MKLVKLSFIACVFMKTICCEEDIACDDTSEEGQTYICIEYNECEHYKQNAVRLQKSENITEVNFTQE